MSDILVCADMEAGPYAGWSPAQIYVEMAKAVIDVEFVGSELTRWDLRTWWRDEAEHRIEYALTERQESNLLDHCRLVAEGLKEGTKNPDEWPEVEKKTYGGKKNTRKAAV